MECNHIVEFGATVTHAYCETDFCCDAEAVVEITHEDEQIQDAGVFYCYYCPLCGKKLDET